MDTAEKFPGNSEILMDKKFPAKRKGDGDFSPVKEGERGKLQPKEEDDSAEEGAGGNFSPRDLAG